MTGTPKFWSGSGRPGIALVLTLFLGCASTGDDLSAAPPLPQGDLVEATPSDHDEQQSSALVNWLRTNGGRDLAYAKPVRASNVRAQSARFTPSALTDGDGATYWTTDEQVTTADVTVEFGESTTFDHVVLREHVELGRRVRAWSLAVRREGTWTEVARGTVLGGERALSFAGVTGDALRLSIEESGACPVLDGIEVYAARVPH